MTRPTPQDAMELITSAQLSHRHVLIKCCGMFRDEDIDAVNVAKPDICGFIVNFPKSHRSVSPERVAELSSKLDAAVIACGVFVDEDPELVASMVRDGSIQMVQLHGHEDSGYIDEVKAAVEAPVVKAFKVRSAADVEEAERCNADLVLLDNGAGTGESFDWSLVSNVKRPFILAGGLDPDNVASAISQTHPLGVDMSSGIETEDLKDAKKIAAAVAAVNEAGEFEYSKMEQAHMQ